jgi:hypothetical protein
VVLIAKLFLLGIGCAHILYLIKLKEFDEPWTLLKDKGSALYHLVEETGRASMDDLKHMAQQVRIQTTKQANNVYVTLTLHIT